MFIAFSGMDYPTIPELVTHSPFEYWNLKKMSYNRFIRRIKSKIPPANDHCSNSFYQLKVPNLTTRMGITKEQYANLSWGILFPNYYDNNYYHFTLAISVFIGRFTAPILYTETVGIRWITYENEERFVEIGDQNLFQLLTDSNFHKFYRKYHSVLSRIIFDLTKVGNWSDEDWRMYLALSFFRDLHVYQDTKTLVTWQKEFVEMSTIMELLLTAEEGEKTEIGYRLKKRFGVLLADVFPDYAKVISKMYDNRSKFIHGSLFRGLRSQVRSDSDGGSLANIMLPNSIWNESEEIRKYLRFLVLSYLILFDRFVTTGFSTSVVALLEKGILDISVRRKIRSVINEVNRDLNL